MNEQSEQGAEYGGQCAFAVSTGKKGVAGQPKYTIEEDGKKYLFSNPISKLLWRILPGRKKKANQNSRSE